MQIVWTEKANITFNEVADYLHWKFQVREVQKFFDRTDEIISNIKSAPYLFKPYENGSQIRHGNLHKNVTLFIVFEEEGIIELLLFWNNYKNPKALKL